MINQLIENNIVSTDLSNIKSKYLNNYPAILQTVANMSYCERKKVGALLISEDYSNILSYGFNGTISGFPNVCELEDGTTNNSIVLHAETNCITKASKFGIKTLNSNIWCTYSPCVDCAKLIIQSGIKELYFLYCYKDLSSLEILHKAGVKIYYLNF